MKIPTALAAAADAAALEKEKLLKTSELCMT